MVKSVLNVPTPTKKKAPKREYVNIITPVGLLSFPYLHKIDSGRAESSDKFSAEIYIPKAVWQKEGKDVYEKILKVGREYFKNPKLKLTEFKNPILDMDTVTGKEVLDYQKGCIRIRAKAGADQKPTIIGPQKIDAKFPVWTDEQVAAIKGGDFGRILGSVYAYPQQGGGVAIGLNFFQFAKVGKAIGQGRSKQLEALDEIEVQVDSPDEMVDTDDEALASGHSADDEDTDPDMKFA